MCLGDIALGCNLLLLLICFLLNNAPEDFGNSLVILQVVQGTTNTQCSRFFTIRLEELNDEFVHARRAIPEARRFLKHVFVNVGATLCMFSDVLD